MLNDGIALTDTVIVEQAVDILERGRKRSARRDISVGKPQINLRVRVICTYLLTRLGGKLKLLTS